MNGTIVTLLPSVGTDGHGNASGDSYAAEHPLCEVCLAKGVYTPTEDIHHKLPLSQGGTHDRSNLMVLAKSAMRGFMPNAATAGIIGRNR